MKNRNPRIQLVCYVAAACFALMPAAFAVDPPPDGGYANLNTAEGDDALLNLTTGFNNTAIGFNALYSDTFGYQNTAIGESAMYNTTTGVQNTATGVEALYSNTSGTANTANGRFALLSNTTGSLNTAIGYSALSFNTGSFNTATGANALYGNTTGTSNTANGIQALLVNTTGSYNTANGYNALETNQTGSYNTATGANALLGDTGNLSNGSYNTANGSQALFSNTIGINNTASGADALHSNTTGNYNTANGQSSLYSNTTGNNNAAYGNNALFNNTNGSGNIALGDSAGINVTTSSNNIDIGNKGIPGDSGKIRIGKKPTHTAAFIQGISGVTVAGGVGVLINTNGQLGTIQSSARVKDNIKPMDKASEAILALQPVTFRYKHDLDPDGIPQFGLVAEQVEKVNPDLVARDEQGKAYTVRYEAVNAMLLNEFLKEHRKVEEQSSQIADQDCKVQKLEATVAQLQWALKAQAAQIQKVSDQVTTQAAGPRVVAND